nr:unnamed protein product [Callosobruchus analis]
MTQEEFYEEIKHIDQHAIDRFNDEITHTGSWHAYAGYYGLKIKHTIEGALKKNIYRTLEHVIRDKNFRKYWFNTNVNRKSPITWYNNRIYLGNAYYEALKAVQNNPNIYTSDLSKDYTEWRDYRIHLLQTKILNLVTRPTIQISAPGETLQTVSEGARSGVKRPTTTDISEQAETQVKRPALRPATNIQPTKQATTTGQPGPIANPQQDILQGNAANTKGSVSGEAGSRKSQKQQGAYFGLIEVINLALHCKEDKLYVCVSTFNFNIRFSTVVNKLKLSICPDRYVAAYYFNIIQRLDDQKDIEDDDKDLSRNYNIMFCTCFAISIQDISHNNIWGNENDLFCDLIVTMLARSKLFTNDWEFIGEVEKAPIRGRHIHLLLFQNIRRTETVIEEIEELIKDTFKGLHVTYNEISNSVTPFIGTANSCKSHIARLIWKLFPLPARIIQDGIFTFANLVNSGCGLWEEPSIAPDLADTAKLVLREGWSDVQIAIKNKGSQILGEKIPIIITTNRTIYSYCSSERVAFEARLFSFTCNKPFPYDNLCTADIHYCNFILDSSSGATSQTTGTSNTVLGKRKRQASHDKRRAMGIISSQPSTL